MKTMLKRKRRRGRKIASGVQQRKALDRGGVRLLAFEALEDRRLLAALDSQIGELEIEISYNLEGYANGDVEQQSGSIGAYRVPLLTSALELNQLDPGEIIEIETRAGRRIYEGEEQFPYADFDAWSDLSAATGAPAITSVLFVTKFDSFGVVDGTPVGIAEANLDITLKPIANQDHPAGSSVILGVAARLDSADAVVCHQFPPWNGCQEVQEQSGLLVEAAGSTSSGQFMDYTAGASSAARLFNIDHGSIDTAFGATSQLHLEHTVSGGLAPSSEARLSQLHIVILATLPQQDLRILTGGVNDGASEELPREDVFWFAHQSFGAYEGPVDVVLVHSDDETYDPDSDDLVLANKQIQISNAPGAATIFNPPTDEPIAGDADKEFLLLVLDPDRTVPELGYANNTFKVCEMPKGEFAENAPDTDGDEIPDCAEILGYKWPGESGDEYVNLPAMGSDPRVKDVFVEIDYTWRDTVFGVTNPFGAIREKPSSRGIKRVQDAFLNAPIEYDHGASGINLHVDFGPKSIMDPRSGAPWGTELSESDRLNISYLYWDDTLLNNFTTVTNPASDTRDGVRQENFSNARAPVFRYGVFAEFVFWNSPCVTNVEVNGIAQGADLAVAGGLIGNMSAAGVGGTKDWETSATFMHELGHTLGLGHGGFERTPNHKPNYISVMNYSYMALQNVFTEPSGIPVPLTINNGEVPLFNGKPFILRYDWNYSTIALDTLDEEQLIEADGLGINSIGQHIRWFVNGEPVSDWVLNSEDLALDWNNNGPIDVDRVGVNLTNNTRECTSEEVFERGLVNNDDDWQQLQYEIVRGGGGSAADLLVEPSLVSNAPPNEQEFFIEVAAGAPVVGAPGETAFVRFVIENSGTNGDTYAIDASSLQGWLDSQSVPESIQLAAGESAEILLSVNVPLDAGETDREEIELTAVSQDGYGLFASDYGEVRLDGEAPRVESVVLTGSGWTPEFSELQEQLQIVDAVSPWSGVNAIRVTFSEDVVVNSRELVVHGSRLTTYPITEFNYDENLHQATWTLESPIDGDRILVELYDTIWDLSYNSLDGELVDSQLPTGDGVAAGRLEAHFSVLAGDANRDGVVDAADTAEIAGRIGNSIGDLNYSLFSDINGNGVIEQIDVDLASGDVQLPERLPTSLTKVTGVALRNSLWTSESADRAHVAIDAAAQPRTLAWGGVDEIRISFSENLIVDQSALSLTGIGGAYPFESFDYDPATATGIWTLTSPIRAERLQLELIDAIVDFDGQQIDGELTAALPSGDGEAGGNLVYHVIVLAGDVDGSGIVDDLDVGAVQAALGAAEGDANYSALLDLDLSGVVDTDDLAIVQSLLTAPWQNPLIPVDVTLDGVVAPNDVLWIINELLRNGARDLATGPQPTSPVDVNGDGFLATDDALAVINRINASIAAGPPPSSAGAPLRAGISSDAALAASAGARLSAEETEDESGQSASTNGDIQWHWLPQPASEGAGASMAREGNVNQAGNFEKTPAPVNIGDGRFLFGGRGPNELLTPSSRTLAITNKADLAAAPIDDVFAELGLPTSGDDLLRSLLRVSCSSTTRFVS